MVDLSFLQSALDQLSRALGYAQREEDGDPELFEQFRNSVIQTFEFSYELSYKTLRRVLIDRAVASDEIDTLGFRDLIRYAARVHFIDDPARWFEYRTARNKTSHAYQESYAMDTYAIAPQFLADAQELFVRLERYGATGELE
jgi:nucleotidyltransferase substrate binding protein (TIGR01987 family)